MKRYWAFLVSVGCVAVAIMVWLLWSDRDSDESAEHAAALILQQSPQVSQPESLLEGASRRPNIEIPNAITKNVDQSIRPIPQLAANASELKFATIEATLDEYTRLVVIEYDRLLGEGLEQLAAQMQARVIVQDRIYKGDAHPELLRSLVYFQDDIPPHELSSTALLARGGRISKTLLPNVFTLPNGELYTIKEPHTKVVVRYQTRPFSTEKKRLDLEKLNDEEQDLLERQRNGELSLEQQLQSVRLKIESMGNPPLTSKSFTYTWGYEDHPDFKIIELNMGLIERSD